jgi:putative transposase
LAWNILSENLPLERFDPIRGGVNGEQLELETPEANVRWREGFRRHEAIRGLLERHTGLLRTADVKDVAWDLGVSQATLYRLITTYKAIGTVGALMPRTSGRPTGLRLLDKKVEALIAKCIREIYLTPNRPTLKRLTDEVHAKCAAAGYSLPDRRTIRARVLAIPERTRAMRRSDTLGVKATTPTPGKLTATRPLEIVQIDHTEVDVVVVDEENRKPLPGRPWLTLAIDVFSRMVTGFHLSMSEPSRLSLGLCMLRATFDKGAWLKDHDVTEEWPTSGLPEMIGVDNGSDFKSATFRRACENEGVRVEFRPPGRPHYGGHIERLMGTMMKDVHALPGTTFSSVAERGRQDPAKSAGLTLHELETYFAIEIVEGYHQRIHRGLQRAPIAVWREFIGETPLRMPKDRMAFWVSFLPEARRKLRPDGVHMFGSLKYWHGALASDLGRSGQEVVVKYDPRDISRIFVGRPSGHYVEARWSDLTWPPVSLHEWDNQQRERGRSARLERDTGAVLRATAKKRSLIERAKRLTYEANEKHLPLSRKPVDRMGLGSLRGVDSSKPVPGEG